MVLLQLQKLKNSLKKFNWRQKNFIVLIIVALIFFGGIFFGLVKLSAIKVYDCSKYPPAPNADVIRMENGQFNPNDLTVNACDTVLFLNLDSDPMRPSVISGTSYPGFDAGRDLAKFDYFQFQLTRTGMYSFYNMLHKNVTGKITIKPLK